MMIENKKTLTIQMSELDVNILTSFFYDVDPESMVEIETDDKQGVTIVVISRTAEFTPVGPYRSRLGSVSYSRPNFRRSTV